MKTVTITEAKSSLERLLYELNDSLLIVESDDGQPLAVVASVRTRKTPNPEIRYPPRTLYEILGEANTRIQERGGIPAEDFWRLVEADYPDEVAEQA